MPEKKKYDKKANSTKAHLPFQLVLQSFNLIVCCGPKFVHFCILQTQQMPTCTSNDGILYKKASIHWQDSAPPISGYWPTSEPNAGNHDFPLTGSNFGNLTAFRAIFSHIFTAHAQEWPFINFQLKFWHHHSIPWSRFPYRARYFGDTRTFSVDFCIG